MWSLAAGKIECSPFARVTREDELALNVDGEEVLRYLGIAA